MTDFRNVKLRVLSREHSAAFQEAAFETGVKWASSGVQEVKRTEAKFLFICGGLEPGLVWDNSPSVFEKSECREILFTTPAYLKTKIQIRDKKHFDFVLEKLRQNGVQGTRLVRILSLPYGDYVAVAHDGFCGAVAREKACRLDDYKEVFIEKDDEEPDNITTQNTIKLDAELLTSVTTRFADTETSDGSTASYYELPSGATELQHLISHKDMNSQIGEIFRSCYRYGQASHSDKLRDAKKIQFYINAEIERLEKLNAK